MLGIGFWECVVVLLVGLLVLKPTELPQAFQTLGQWCAKSRRFYQMLQYQWVSALEKVEEKEIEEKKEIKESAHVD